MSLSTEFPARRPKRAPTHPGAILREDVLPAIGMSVTEVAERLHVTRQTLHRILAEKAAVTPEMAVRLGRFLGNGPGIWLRMQTAYDLWQAETQLRADVKTIRRVKRATFGAELLQSAEEAVATAKGKAAARTVPAPRRAPKPTASPLAE